MFTVSRPEVLPRIALVLALAAAALAPAPAGAHDPSAWGGLFRTRDFGANWFPADAGLFIGGALGVAIHPEDPAQLLYGTDARLLRTRNGGRDWVTESAPAMIGAVFAVVFDADGKGALASTGTRIFRFEQEGGWRDVFAPAGAAPARSFARSTGRRDRVYLAGAHGLFVSGDKGKTWTRSGDGVLPDDAVVSLIVAPGTPEKLYAVVGGDIWTSADGGDSWSRPASGLPAGRVDAISADAGKSDRLWAVVAAQVYVSDDAGSKWTVRGNAISDTGLSVRGIAVSADEKIMVVSTHRGVFRSTDGGQSWKQVESTLPVHLESGLLLRDPHDPSTLYAGFSLSPYGETWRRAEQGGSLLAQTDPVSLAGGLAFLVVLIIAGAAATRWLMRRSRGANAAIR
ncbi:MAG TPA: hypothetical protein VFV71_07800 [Burkholderiales bacterium]|nr:hypothetical protein [Burkholderiales bacterium]